MNLKIASHNAKIQLVDLLIFLLVFLGEIPRIYVFSNMAALSTVINFLQIPAYLGLLFIIFRRKYPIKRLMGYAVALLILLVGYFQSGQAAYFRGGY